MSWKASFGMFLLIINLSLSVLLWIAVVGQDDKTYLKYEKMNNTSMHTSALRDDSTNRIDQQFAHTRKIVIETHYPVVLGRPYKINNEKICRTVSNLSVIVMVTTAPSHFEIRKQMRQTYLNSNYYDDKNIRVVFLLGLLSDSTLQNKIEEENLAFNDIVQGHFIDSYQNLTNKGVMGFKWITEFCQNAEFVLKIDDDVFVNFFAVFDIVSPIIKKKSKYIMCYVADPWTQPVQRGENSRWYVHPDKFRHFDYYPYKSCSGFAAFLSTDLIPMLYKSALISPFFWVDDVYLFGILPSKINGTVHHKIQSSMSLYDNRGLQCYNDKGKHCPIVVAYKNGKNDFINRCLEAVIKNTNNSVTVQHN